jgi:hypothetical protein
VKRFFGMSFALVVIVAALMGVAGTFYLAAAGLG